MIVKVVLVDMFLGFSKMGLNIVIYLTLQISKFKNLYGKYTSLLQIIFDYFLGNLQETNFFCEWHHDTHMAIKFAQTLVKSSKT